MSTRSLPLTRSAVVIVAIIALAAIAIVLALRPQPVRQTPDTIEREGGTDMLTQVDWERGIQYGIRYWRGECSPLTLAYAQLANNGAVAYSGGRACAIILDPDNFGEGSYITLKGLAVHEVGHLAGCEHSTSTRSIMYPRVNAKRAHNVTVHFRDRHRPHRC